VANYPPEVMQLLLLAIGAVLGLCSGLIAFYLKEVRRALREDVGEVEEEQSHLRRDLSRLEAGLPEKYVLRDDYIRAQCSIDERLQSIARDVSSLNKNVAALAGRGGGNEDAS